MRKPFHRYASLGVFLVAAVFATAAAPPATEVPSPVKVSFVVAPEEVYCYQSSKDMFLEISYGWDPNSDLAPLENLLPIGSKAAPRSSLPGILTTTSRIGAVSKPSLNVDYGPGLTKMIYTPNQTGHEVLKTHLAYGVYEKGDTVEFEVKECEYYFEIYAAMVVEGEDYLTYSITKAEGYLSADGNSLSGEIETEGITYLAGKNPVLKCTSKQSRGKSVMMVSGEIIESSMPWGDTTYKLHLTYADFSNSTEGNLVCVDKISGEKTERPAPKVQGNPGQYLLREVAFAGDHPQPLEGSYGEGNAYYTFRKVKP
jgi:hypothetical protein